MESRRCLVSPGFLMERIESGPQPEKTLCSSVDPEEIHRLWVFKNVQTLRFLSGSCFPITLAFQLSSATLTLMCRPSAHNQPWDCQHVDFENSSYYDSRKQSSTLKLFPCKLVCSSHGKYCGSCRVLSRYYDLFGLFMLHNVPDSLQQHCNLMFHADCFCCRWYCWSSAWKFIQRKQNRLWQHRIGSLQWAVCLWRMVRPQNFSIFGWN